MIPGEALPRPLAVVVLSSIFLAKAIQSEYHHFPRNSEIQVTKGGSPVWVW